MSMFSALIMAFIIRTMWHYAYFMGEDVRLKLEVTHTSYSPIHLLNKEQCHRLNTGLLMPKLIRQHRLLIKQTFRGCTQGTNQPHS